MTDSLSDCPIAWARANPAPARPAGYPASHQCLAWRAMEDAARVDSTLEKGGDGEAAA